MSPSRCRYFHEILASHLTKLGGLGASHYECLIYHYSKSGNEALEFKYHVLLLEEHAKRYYELYPMRHALDHNQEGAALPFLEYCDSLETRLLSLSPDALSKINAPLLYISLLRSKAQYCIAQSARKLSSPYSLGFLVYTRYLLRYKFKDSFQKLLPLSADEYREEAIRYLRNIPGTYELKELF